VRRCSTVRECRAHSLRHGAPGEPCGKGANIGRRAIQTDVAFPDGFRQGQAAEPDLVKRHNAGSQDHIDLITRILQADRNITGIDQKPVASLRGAAKVELNDNSSVRHAIDGDPSAHPPQQDDRVEFVWPRGTKGPARTPLAEEIDDWLELASCWGQTIFDPLAGDPPRRSSTPVCSSRRSLSASSVRDT